MSETKVRDYIDALENSLSISRKIIDTAEEHVGLLHDLCRTYARNEISFLESLETSTRIENRLTFLREESKRLA